MTNKTKDFFKYLKSIWPTVRTWLVKTLLTKYLPKLVSGPWGWIVTFFGEKIFDKVIKPGWNWLTRKAYAITNKLKRKSKVKRFENAQTESEFDDSFDDLP